MRSASVNTLWIQTATTSSLCIIPTIELSQPAKFLVGGHPTGTSGIAFQLLQSSFDGDR
jgi:hypothetical protein